MLAMISFFRSEVWKSEQRLWAEAIERSPGKLRPRLMLARVEVTTAASVRERVCARRNSPVVAVASITTCVAATRWNSRK